MTGTQERLPQRAASQTHEAQTTMTPEQEQDRAMARRARVLAVVIVATALFWLGGQWLGGKLGLEARYVFLLDFAAIAAFIWALVVATAMWRKRRG